MAFFAVFAFVDLTANFKVVVKVIATATAIAEQGFGFDRF